MSTILVSVVGPAGRQDLSLPADAPIYELLPSLVQLVGDKGADGPVEPHSWKLAPVTGDALATGSSLAESGVLDGTVLYLTRAAPAGEPDVAAPPSIADDGRTPAERTQAVLPPRYGRAERLRRAVAALFRGRAAGDAETPEAPASPPPPSGSEPLPRAPETPPAASPAALTRRRRQPALERARQAWRATDYLESLDAAIAKPRLRRSATIAVVSPKGGVGKTTVTALVGSLFALLRRDRVVAVDTNPDFGSLGRILVPEQMLFVDDLLERLDQPKLTLTGLDAQLGRAAHGLMVLPAPTDPDRMARLDEDAYTKVITRLQEYVGALLLDCGTGLQEPAARAAINTSDQLVLVTDAEPAAASLVAEAGPMLVRTGRPITLVVNKMPGRRSRLDLERLGRHLHHANALVVIPSDEDAAGRLASGRFDWRDAPASWQRACRELAVALVADWPRLGLTLTPPPGGG